MLREEQEVILILSHLRFPPNATFWLPDGALIEGDGEPSTILNRQDHPETGRNVIRKVL